MNVEHQFIGLKVSVRKNYQLPLDYEVQMDPNQIREVLTNVLTNAFQAIHTLMGRIDVSVQEEREGVIKIRIEDNGRGIHPDDMENIFRPFFTTKAKGTGLGLSICNELVNLHHGRLDLQSVQDQGTIVQITLPIVS